jgi:protein-serine/threonine kinase
MDRDLRVPYVMSDDSIDLIRGMLNRDVDARLDIQGVLDHAWFQEIKEEEEGAGAEED